jgi:Integrase core domain
MLKKILKNVINKPINKTLDELYKQPTKERDKAQFQVFKSNLIQQADLLYVPNDSGYKYILVVVDDHSRKLDAEKLRNKDSSTIVKAFEKIYNRHILELPKDTIELDSGVEFKNNDIRNYFDKHNVRIRYALVGRHRAEALVERKNQILGTLIHRIQAHKELETGRTNKQWIKYLPDLVREINNHLPKPINEAISSDPIINDYNKKLLEKGYSVRVLLDYPIDMNNKRLYGNFRSGDIRWSPQIYKITEVLLKPGMPPEYLTTKTNQVAYSKEQLQLVTHHFV